MSQLNSITIKRGYSGSRQVHYPVVIIGAGEAGIAMGCELKRKLGFDQFRIFDRQSGIGGTWWINRYPGVACDVPTSLYSFSFAPYYDSKRLFPTGEEFVDYLHRVAAQFQLVDKVQLNTEVVKVHWIESELEWELELRHLATGVGDMTKSEKEHQIATKGYDAVYLGVEKIRAKVVVSCVGILVEPQPWPSDLPGYANFKGSIIHPSRWLDDVKLHGKDVVVIGAGASAVQIVPELFKKQYNVKSVTQLMRSPPWVMERLGEPFGAEKYAKYAPFLYRHVPLLGFSTRMMLYFFVELMFLTVFQARYRGMRSKLEKSLLDRTYSMIPEKYHKLMTPNYPFGCKRRVFDNEWLQSLNRSNMYLTSRTIQRIEDSKVILGSLIHTGNEDDSVTELEVPADVIIHANGYRVTEWLHSLPVFGIGDKSLHTVWAERGGPQAYMGTAMDGFPNFFMVNGPNTIVGHTSVILASENAARYIIKIIKPILCGDAITAECTKEAEVRWTSRIQKEMKQLVFHSCTSWYQEKDGWNSTLYS